MNDIIAAILVISSFGITIPTNYDSDIVIDEPVIKEEIQGEIQTFVDIPILNYHHLDNDESNMSSISAENFESHMIALKNEGYNTILFDELNDYMTAGTALPENPLILTFDDGYKSNYEIAYPILEKYDMKATILLIGKYIPPEDGQSPYKTSFMNFDNARELDKCENIDIQAHTYDMHKYKDDGVLRRGTLKKKGESAEDYLNALTTDFTLSKQQFQQELNKTPYVFAYPLGLYNGTTETVLDSLGFSITLTSDIGMNRVFHGNPENLKLMKRYSVQGSDSASEIISFLNNLK